MKTTIKIIGTLLFLASISLGYVGIATFSEEDAATILKFEQRKPLAFPDLLKKPAKTTAAPEPREYWFEAEIKSDSDISSRLYWDSGKGLSEREATSANTSKNEDFQKIIFPLPSDTAIHAFRFDPAYTEFNITLRNFQIVSKTRGVIKKFSPASFVRNNAVHSWKVEGDSLKTSSPAPARVGGFAIKLPAPAVLPEFFLEMELATKKNLIPQLFWSTGGAFSESNSRRIAVIGKPDGAFQKLSFPLPSKTITAFRFDPSQGEFEVQLRNINLTRSGKVLEKISVKKVLQDKQIQEIKISGDTATILSTKSAKDPSVRFSPDASLILGKQLYTLELEAAFDAPADILVSFDTGGGFNEKETSKRQCRGGGNFEILSFPLTGKEIKSIRLELPGKSSIVKIKNLRIFADKGIVNEKLPFESVSWENDIQSLGRRESVLFVETAKDAKKPQLKITFKKTLARLPKSSFPEKAWYMDFAEDIDAFVQNEPALNSWLSERIFSRYFLLENYSTLGNKIGDSAFPDRVVKGLDGWLFLGDYNSSVVTKFLGLTDGRVNAREIQFIRTLQELSAERQAVFIYASAPNKHSIYSEYLPAWARKSRPEMRPERIMGKSTQEEGLPFLNLEHVVRAGRKKTDYLLYHKDGTHWNELGAYYGYEQIMDFLISKEPSLARPAEKIYIKGKDGTGSNDLHVHNIDTRKTIFQDHSYVWFHGVPEDIRCQFELNGVKSMQRILPAQWLPPGSVCITTNPLAVNKKRLLFITDSFGTALSPYLLWTFADIIKVHSGTVRTPAAYRALLEAHKPDAVLYLSVARKL
jgi:hypothetical protein